MQEWRKYKCVHVFSSTVLASSETLTGFQPVCSQVLTVINLHKLMHSYSYGGCGGSE